MEKEEKKNQRKESKGGQRKLSFKRREVHRGAKGLFFRGGRRKTKV